MDKVTFEGLVLPRGLKFRLSSQLIDWYAEDEGITKIKCQCLIDKGIVTVDIYMEEFNISYATQLYKRATDFSRTLVNTMTLGSGAVIVLLLDKITYPHGLTRHITRADFEGKDIITSFNLSDHSDSFSESLVSVLKDKELYMAIDDFVVGIDHHHMSEANCRRALDRLRHAIAPGINDKKRGWSILNRQLNIEGNSLEALIKITHANSHGDPIYKTGKAVAPTMAKTLSVINRFIEYRNRGSIALTEPDFDLLVL